MEDFEGSTGSLLVVAAQEFSLGCEADFLEADLISPANEVGEEDVEGEVLVAGVLVGFRWEEAHVVGVGAERSEGAAVVDFMGISAVVDGEHFTLLKESEIVVEPLVDRLWDFKAFGRVFEELRVGKLFRSLPNFLMALIQEEFFESVIEDADGEGVEEFVGDEECFPSGFCKGLLECLVPGSFVLLLLLGREVR